MALIQSICINKLRFNANLKNKYNPKQNQIKEIAIYHKTCIKIIVKMTKFMLRTILYLITNCGSRGHFNNQDYYLQIISRNRYIDPA